MKMVERIRSTGDERGRRLDSVLILRTNNFRISVAQPCTRKTHRTGVWWRRACWHRLPSLPQRDQLADYKPLSPSLENALGIRSVSSAPHVSASSRIERKKAMSLLSDHHPRGLPSGFGVDSQSVIQYEKQTHHGPRARYKMVQALNVKLCGRYIVLTGPSSSSFLDSPPIERCLPFAYSDH